jgi:hypothetical protein
MFARRSRPVMRASSGVETPLERLLVARNISPARLEEKLRERMNERAPDERQIRRWRLGRSEPRRKSIVRLLWAVREVANDTTIGVEDIIDFHPDNPANWKD